jgi:hypothetical protein
MLSSKRLLAPGLTRALYTWPVPYRPYTWPMSDAYAS